MNLKINRETFCSANSLSDTGLALVWAGARANHGVKNNGKYFYEVQLVALNTKINYPNERRLHELRCGWSSSNSNLQLGENELSYGLDTSGKKCANNEFSDYSVKFGAIGDVIGVHLDVNDEMCNIQFNVNGKEQGIAFEFEKSSLNDEALFPHIVTKNIEFKVNFGQLENSLWSQARDGFKVSELKRRREELEKKKKDQEKARDDKIKKKELELKKAEDAAAKKIEDDAAKKVEEEAAAAQKAKEELEQVPMESGSEVTPEATENGNEQSEESKESTEEAVEADKPAEEQVAESSAEAVAETVAVAEPVAETVAVAEPVAVAEEAAKPEEVKPTEVEPEEAEEDQVVYPDDITEEEVDNDVPLLNCLADYQYIGKYEIETLASGPRRPESRKECEVIMLIGLPGAGKSFWALQRSKDNPTKRYTILGTKYLLEKMKIQGEPRKPNSGPGRWEKLIELCNRGLLTLNEIACQRRRNYILDQPHVYTSDQRRKMRVYGDFNRIAVIVVATEEEYKRRFQQRLEIEGKDIPEAAINEMRANLSLPELEYLWFNEIMYADLEKEPAHLEVSKENERGKKALSQRSRHNDYNRGRDGYGNRNQQDNRSRWSGAGNSGNANNAGGGGNGGGRNDNYRRNDRWGPASGQRQMPLPPVGGGYRRDFDYNGRDRGRNWGGSDWMNNRPRGGYGGAPPPRPGRKPEERRDDRGGRGGEYRDNRRNDNRNDNRRDYRSGSGSSSGNRKPDERRHDDRNRNKQSGKSDWNSAGSGSGNSGQWNYNNYSAGGSGGGGGNQGKYSFIN